MELIEPSIEIIEQGNGLEGMMKHIELCGRLSHKSEGRITDKSYEKFVEMLKRLGHISVLSHGTVYLKVPHKDENTVKFYSQNHWSSLGQYDKENPDTFYITTNYEVIAENKREEDLENYYCDNPSFFHDKRLTVKVICSNGEAREFNRHTSNSITEKSTRYVDFSNDKNGKCIKFIKPSWYNKENSDSKLKEWFIETCELCEKQYMIGRELGLKPELARGALNFFGATEIIYTAFLNDTKNIKGWQHFLSLRSSDYGAKGVHPDAAIIGNMIYKELHNRNLLL